MPHISLAHVVVSSKMLSGLFKVGSAFREAERHVGSPR